MRQPAVRVNLWMMTPLRLHLPNHLPSLPVQYRFSCSLLFPACDCLGMKDNFSPVCQLGRVVLTPGAKMWLSRMDVLNALLCRMRDGRVDGDSPPRSKHLAGCRTLNVYRSSAGHRFWTITEADGALTIVLMPEEFSRHATRRIRT